MKLLILAQGPIARYVKLPVTHAPEMPRTFSQPPRVSHPDMHHGTCLSRRDRKLVVSFEVVRGENVPGIPGTCTTSNFTYLIRGPWLYLDCVWTIDR